MIRDLIGKQENLVEYSNKIRQEALRQGEELQQANNEKLMFEERCNSMEIEINKLNDLEVVVQKMQNETDNLQNENNSKETRNNQTI